MNRWLGTCAGVLATLVSFIAIDVALFYLMFGIGFGIKDIAWFPIFPLCIVVGGAAAVAICARLWRGHWIAVTCTAVACTVLTVPLLGIAFFMGAWGCSDGGGCHGSLAR